jgi:hypothetical protein
MSLARREQATRLRPVGMARFIAEVGTLASSATQTTTRLDKNETRERSKKSARLSLAELNASTSAAKTWLLAFLHA